MQIGNEQVFAVKENSKMENLNSYKDRDYKKMSDKKLKDAACEFESIFMNQLFKSMRSTLPKDQWLDGGMKQEIFEDMLYNEHAKNFSKQGGIGLGDMVYKYLKSTKGI